jgi:hypothetical protein
MLWLQKDDDGPKEKAKPRGGNRLCMFYCGGGAKFSFREERNGVLRIILLIALCSAISAVPPSLAFISADGSHIRYELVVQQQC